MHLYVILSLLTSCLLRTDTFLLMLPYINDLHHPNRMFKVRSSCRKFWLCCFITGSSVPCIVSFYFGHFQVRTMFYWHEWNLPGIDELPLQSEGSQHKVRFLMKMVGSQWRSWDLTKEGTLTFKSRGSFWRWGDFTDEREENSLTKIDP